VSGNGEPGDKPGARVGPWTRHESRPLYDNPWIRLREDAVTQPDGRPGVYGVVEFNNLTLGVVALNASGEVILVGQHRYPLDYYSWEIPEGGGPKGSSPEAGAARELREETGLEAGRWDYLGCLVLSNAVTDEIGHLFLARDLIQHTPQPEPTEVLRTRWLPFEEACREAFEGRITDSISTVALSRARHFLELEKRGLPAPEYPRHPAGG
jgi:8-oxo-dGTP pyrophosphatase MutT (NUDIX family)